LQFQDNLTVQSRFSGTSPNIKAINYKSEPLINKLNRLNSGAQGRYVLADIYNYTSNSSFTTPRYPVTPRMVAGPGQALRIRLVNSGGSGTGESFNLHGHVWQEEPYVNGSKNLGDNKMSQWFGYRDQLGALNSFNLLIKSAGGRNRIPGDYFYNSTTNATFAPGMWGILTVTTKKDYIQVTSIAIDSILKTANISGWVTVRPDSGIVASNSITLEIEGIGGLNSTGVQPDGTWKFENIKYNNLMDEFTFRTSAGGEFVTSLQSLLPEKQPVLNPMYKPRPRVIGRGIKPETQQSEKQ